MDTPRVTIPRDLLIVAMGLGPVLGVAAMFGLAFAGPADDISLLTGSLLAATLTGVLTFGYATARRVPLRVGISLVVTSLIVAFLLGAVAIFGLVLWIVDGFSDFN